MPQFLQNLAMVHTARDQQTTLTLHSLHLICNYYTLEAIIITMHMCGCPLTAVKIMQDRYGLVASPVN